MNITLRVLSVEDSSLDAEWLRCHLLSAGFAPVFERVETLEGMKTALETELWDVILCDYSMPEFNASAALGLVKRMGLDIPFIIISGIIGEEVAVQMMQEGAHDYLMKNNLARLAPAIKRHLEDAKNRWAGRHAEASLEASEAELRSLFAAMIDGIFVLDTKGRFLKVAPTEPTYSSESSAMRVGKTLHEIFPKQTADLFLEHIRYVLDRGNRCSIEYSLPVNGLELWFDGSVSPLANDSVLWIARDVTERKHLEEQLRQSQKLEAVGQLAGGIAHDFNNLLTAITGYSELTLRSLPPEDRLRGNIEEIKNAGDRAAALTRQLLAFSRKQVLQPKVIDLNTVVAEIEKMLRRLIGEDIELQAVLAPELGNVRGDPGQIEQVIVNLAVNARDAMENGGKLSIETQNVYLDEKSDSQLIGVIPGLYVMLVVSDTGIGMDDQTQHRIFDPFFTTKELGQGTGLGLSTVYGIVKQSGGQICVYSEVGQGTSFKVYFPRVYQEAQVLEPCKKAQDALSGTETILLAEDEEIVCSLMREVLESYGYQVLEAANGVAALLLCERHQGPIHLMITDVVMPGMSGRELTDRQAHIRSEMKVLFMSGYTDDAIVRHGILESEIAFLQKPFSPEVLARKVREVLGHA